MNKRSMRNRNRGGVSTYCLFAMVVLLVAEMGAAGAASTTLLRARNDADSAVAFELAQASMDHGIAQAFEDLQRTRGEFRSWNYDIAPAIADAFPGATATAVVAPSVDGTYAYITSEITVGDRTKSLRTLVRAKDVGIWNNAIFAGTGAAGRAINGNVDIRGSVHILGDGEAYSDTNGNGQYDAAEAFTDRNRNGVWDPGEPFTDTNGDRVWNAAEPFNDTNGNGFYDPPLTQTDLNSTFSGTALIGNHYSGMPLQLEQIVPVPPRIGGIETLSAELRVKHGQVAIGGNASVGQNNTIDGGTSKATLDGSFVSDGYTGNKGASAVFSDNGTGNGYDLDALDINFPLLSGIGSQVYTAADGSRWTNHEAFLNSRSLTVPVETITASTSSFNYGPDAHGNRITFVKATSSTPAILSISGIVRVNGDLQLGAKDTIRYTGSGTLYATQDMRVDGNLLPIPGRTFPTQDRMGFIAKRNLLLATGSGSSQLQMAGAFYAQGQITSAKQNQILGTFVANFFDMGTNVPNIYQVPSLPKNMPPGMPGDISIVSLRHRGWRERSPSEVGGAGGTLGQVVQGTL